MKRLPPLRILAGLIGAACWIAGGALAREQPPVGSQQLPPITRIPGKLDPSWQVGWWIWEDRMHDKQTSRFWRAFQIPQGPKVSEAVLRISVDNGYRLMMDGRELGTGSDWRSITEYDITELVGAGKHVLAVEGFNDNREAGMVFGLRVRFEDGTVIEIPSDTRWRVAPAGEKGWERKSTAPPHWKYAVEVPAVLVRPSERHERAPTMVVKVPPLRPVVVQFWQNRWFQTALVVVLGLSVLFSLQLLARLAVQAKARRMLVRERARIRDIHDELGARLTELALEGEVVLTELPDASEARPKLEALCEKARSVSGAMDEVVWVVNSKRDTVPDFAAYASKQIRRFLEPTPIRCRLDLDPDIPDAAFELPVRRSLLLAVKEAVNNAVKYSGAGELTLRIHSRGSSLTVTIEDDGRGFDPVLVDPSRNGLTNMRERMAEVGGTCQVTTAPGEGCRIVFQVPIARAGGRLHPFART
jgi:signal transduction histidine kinase